MMDTALMLDPSSSIEGEDLGLVWPVGGVAGGAGGFKYIMWLEDDAVLHAGWSVALQEAGMLRGCMTALHKCNYHSCTAQGLYNGVGMVAVLFERTRLLLLLARIKEWPEESAFTALDTRVYELCGKGEHGLDQARYFMPMDGLATHQGSIARTTTKPPQQMRVVITFPAAGQVRLHCYHAMPPGHFCFYVGLFSPQEFCGNKAGKFCGDSLRLVLQIHFTYARICTYMRMYSWSHSNSKSDSGNGMNESCHMHVRVLSHR